MSMRPSLMKTRNQVSRSDLNVQKENLPRASQFKPTTFGVAKLNRINKKEKIIKTTFGIKRKNDENCDVSNVAKKRSAFGDVTNAIEKTFILNAKDGKKAAAAEILKQKPSLKNIGLSHANNAQKGAAEILKQKQSLKNIGLSHANNAQKGLVTDKMLIEKAKLGLPSKNVRCEKKPIIENRLEDSLEESIYVLSQEMKLNKISLEESSYVTASEGSPGLSPKKATTLRELGPPPGVDDFDKSCGNDPFAVSIYAMDIFNYYKGREKCFPMDNYINRQSDISKTMRSILVDWMVEVQESFELNHETLYLAVKLVDLYLSKVVIARHRLQLIGSTAIFIACKFDERTPPCIDDFLYICDDAYKMKELILLEIEMLKTLKYDLGIPLSYRFLRRYARCCKISMETLTFARFILEMSLMEYDLIDNSDSIMAAAALFVALSVKDNIKEWSDSLKYYSGYEKKDFYEVAKSLHQMLSQPPKDHLKTIRNKYSHKIFFEVAKIKFPDTLV